MSEDEMINEVREQAKKLGGGWRMNQGLVPNVVLTSVEAARIIERLENTPIAIKVQYKGETLTFPWSDLTLYYLESD